MNDGFIKCACAVPHVSVADVDSNVKEMKDLMKQAVKEGAGIVAFPELSITGYTCGDLFGQSALLEKAFSGLLQLVSESAGYDAIFFAGLPFAVSNHLYNCAAVFSKGEILGLVPKTYIPDYHEFYEVRQFFPAKDKEVFDGIDVKISEDVYCPFGTNLIFSSESMKGLKIGVEICEDLWVPEPPSTSAALNGADIIVNLSASNEIIGKREYRRSLVLSQSARTISGYVYSCAGPSESTTDTVFAGHSMIAENGTMLSESEPFFEGLTFADIDVERLLSERRRMNTFTGTIIPDFNEIEFTTPFPDSELQRTFPPHPFVPSDENELSSRCREIFAIQTLGLAKRLQAAYAKKAVIGISGGLDSTLALLVTVKAFDRLKLERKNIVTVTMPGFGTTDRTYENAITLMKHLGTDIREISIVPAMKQHFSDIGLSEDDRSVTYENSQARERTQILMDIANKENGIVIGTGDLSELALGWATYNGDHMSMYGVNASVPKTLVRYLVRYEAVSRNKDDSKLSEALCDILDTPVSPELLPPKDGEIQQKTEDIVGPYELHDFFLYYMMRFGFSPKKIMRMAEIAFSGSYEKEEILKWEKVFYKRFFSQQFKRSALPDGPKVGSVSLSPRGDWRMPSDAVASLWISEIEKMEKEV